MIVGTANETKSEPASTLNHHGIDQTAAGDLNEVVARLAAAVETARNVVGKRQASLDDAVPLTAELCRVL